MRNGKRICLIALMNTEGVISVNGNQPWYIKEDLQRFKSLTTERDVIVGRKTFEVIREKTKGRLLPSRNLIVLSRNAPPLEGAAVARDWDEALSFATGDEMYIAGGAEIYSQSVAFADVAYLSIVRMPVFGHDLRFFPELQWPAWKIEEEDQLITEKGTCSFVRFERMPLV